VQQSVCGGGEGGNRATAAIRVVLVLGWLTAGLEGTSDLDHPLRAMVAESGQRESTTVLVSSTV